jgi:hypothetical protein
MPLDTKICKYDPKYFSVKNILGAEFSESENLG